MLTNDPKKMLKSLHKKCTEDARLGITIWGNKTSNNFITLFGKAVQALGLPMLGDRSPFYLNELIDEMAAECGWEAEFSWEQNATFPIIERSDMLSYINYQISTATVYSREDAKRIGEKMM